MAGRWRFFRGLLAVGLLLSSEAGAFLINEWEPMDVGSGTTREEVVPEPGRPWQEPVSGMNLLWIAGGCFRMGSADSAEGRDADEGPLHEVCLSGFWLADREMTQGQWQGVMRNNPAQLRKGDDFPVENISRADVEALTAKLNRRFKGRVRFRLPTEAEWEYACREGGLNIPLAGAGQPTQLGWTGLNSDGSHQVTATRHPNRLGLYDMGGNVWEWIADNYAKDAYGRHQRNDPLINDKGVFQVVRGGGWKSDANEMRCANRGFEQAVIKRADLGLRLAAVVDVEVEAGRPDISEMPF